jgi:hypothetical protein
MPWTGITQLSPLRSGFEPTTCFAADVDDLLLTLKDGPGGAQGAQGGAAPEAAAPLPPPPPPQVPPQVPPPPQALRCLDGSHPAGCTRCTPAPEAGQEHEHELSGVEGKKNGEKRRGAARAARRARRARWRAAVHASRPKWIPRDSASRRARCSRAR